MLWEGGKLFGFVGFQSDSAMGLNEDRRNEWDAITESRGEFSISILHRVGVAVTFPQRLCPWQPGISTLLNERSWLLPCVGFLSHPHQTLLACAATGAWNGQGGPVTLAPAQCGGRGPIVVSSLLP